MNISCQKCKFFSKIDDKYGRCNCPEAGGGHSIIVEVIEDCEFFEPQTQEKTQEQIQNGKVKNPNK